MSDATLPPRLAEAVAFAAAVHGRDARKGTSIPVLTHLFAVCLLVQRDGGDEDEAIAALLHDTLEDHPETVTADDLEQRFGPRVRRLVEVCTDTPPDYRGGPKGPWSERKQRYLDHARAADPRDLRVTVADKVDNLRAIHADLAVHGEALWTRFNAGPAQQHWYYRRALEAYVAAGFRGPLLDELRALVDALGD